MLVHSCIYYRFNTSIITDGSWDYKAKQLVKLQKEFPSISKAVDYYEEFKDFDGTTGYHLPIGNYEIVSKAQQLIDYHIYRNKKQSKKTKKRNNNKKLKNC